MTSTEIKIYSPKGAELTGRRTLLWQGVLRFSDKAAAAAAALLFLDIMAAIEKSVALVLTEGTTSMAAAAVGKAGVASCTAPKIIFKKIFYPREREKLKITDGQVHFPTDKI